MTIDGLYDECCRKLTTSGWSSEPSGSGTSFRKDRCVIIIAPRDGAMIWTVFPTPPQLPRGVVTKPHPIPVATFTLELKGQVFEVWNHVVDRNGSLTKKPFLTGAVHTVFDTLLDASTEAVREFVSGVERTR
jgi:hypothetical protein